MNPTRQRRPTCASCTLVWAPTFPHRRSSLMAAAKAAGCRCTPSTLPLMRTSDTPLHENGTHPRYA